MKGFAQDLEGLATAVWLPSVNLDNGRGQGTVRFQAFASAAAVKAGRGSIGDAKVYYLKGEEYKQFIASLADETLWDACLAWAKAKKDQGKADDRVSFFENATVVDL